MAKAWAVTVLKQQVVGETVQNLIADRTVVYADNQIEATRLGQNELGTPNVDVQEIPGGDIPTDAEVNAYQEQLRRDVADLGTIERAGGAAYE